MGKICQTSFEGNKDSVFVYYIRLLQKIIYLIYISMNFISYFRHFTKNYFQNFNYLYNTYRYTYNIFKKLKQKRQCIKHVKKNCNKWKTNNEDV